MILTGDAAALGNDASTTIVQTAAGAVSGSHYASANQRATVANLGLALANTGYNARSPTRARSTSARSRPRRPS